MAKIVLLSVNLICVWISVARATTSDQRTPSDAELASSPLIQRLLDRVDLLEKQGERQAATIQTLQKEVNIQRLNIRELSSKLSDKDTVNRSLFREVDHTADDGEAKSIDGEIKHTNTPIEHVPYVETQTKSQKRHKEDGDNRIRQLERQAFVAFSACLTHHMIHVGDNQTIVFDHVVTNVGNAYNSNYGVFTAPVSGAYVFSASILSYDSLVSIAYITVNGEHKSAIYTRDDYHDMSSQTMVFDLHEGDVVAIHGRAGDTYYGRDSPAYTTFTGFILQHNYLNIGTIVG